MTSRNWSRPASVAASGTFAEGESKGYLRRASTLLSAKLKAKGGVILAEDIDLPEWATVTVVLNQDAANRDVEVRPSRSLNSTRRAIDEADRWEGIPWETVPAELFSGC